MKKRICLAVAIALCLSSISFADSIVIDAARDTTIYEDNTGNSNGAGDFLFAGQNGGSSPRRGLIAFDLSMIPQNATIDSVSLSLFVSQANSTMADVSLHRLEADWGEGTSDAPGGEGGGTAAAAGDATWDDSVFGMTAWASQGGDFAPNASATTTVGGAGSAYTWSAPELAADIQGWLDGSVNNFGWIIVGDETFASSSKRFNSRSNGSNTPALTVNFTVVPEPTTGVMIGMGVMFMAGFRRKI